MGTFLELNRAMTFLAIRVIIWKHCAAEHSGKAVVHGFKNVIQALISTIKKLCMWLRTRGKHRKKNQFDKLGTEDSAYYYKQ